MFQVTLVRLVRRSGETTLLRKTVAASTLSVRNRLPALPIVAHGAQTIKSVTNGFIKLMGCKDLTKIGFASFVSVKVLPKLRLVPFLAQAPRCHPRHRLHRQHRNQSHGLMRLI